MDLEDTIYKRQSIRAYEKTPLDEETLDEIRNFIDNAEVLNQNISWSYDIVAVENIKTMVRWKAPHYLILFSQKKENYLENIGFIFQQQTYSSKARELGLVG